ncbi:MAG: sugar-binding domain-containing protein [Actinomycetota bacterium]
MLDDNTRTELAVRVAWLYHERGLTQQEVADRLGLSRSTVSRVLSDAERDGIIRVVITKPLPETARLAEALIERYGLSGAVVGPALDDEPPAVAAATAMARRLESIAASGSVTIAAGWGRTIALSARETRPTPTSHVVVVDAFGHTTTDDTTAAVEVTNTLSRKFDAKVMHVPSPGFVASRELAESFLDSPPVARSLETARTADVIIVSVGVIGPESLLLAEGFINQEGMDEVVAAGAVGEVFGWYFNAAGHAVDAPGMYPIALTPDDLRSATRVIGVAGGAEKAAAIKGAIAAGFLDELAIDETLAGALLQ